MDRHPGVPDSIESLNDDGATRREKSFLERQLPSTAGQRKKKTVGRTPLLG
ncbi:MAG: hypothetical protein ACYS6K_26075 [Planctomycetota bacterium]